MPDSFYRTKLFGDSKLRFLRQFIVLVQKIRVKLASPNFDGYIFSENYRKALIYLGKINWLSDMDSNHDKSLQRALCYRYTIGQTAAKIPPPHEPRKFGIWDA